MPRGNPTPVAQRMFKYRARKHYAEAVAAAKRAGISEGMIASIRRNPSLWAEDARRELAYAQARLELIYATSNAKSYLAHEAEQFTLPNT